MKKLKIDGALLNGNNDQSSYDSYYSRLSYMVYAFKDHKDSGVDTPVRNFWLGENMLYGKVDPSFYPVMPLRREMVEIPGTEGKLTLPFVSAAFVEFRKEMRNATLAGKIRNLGFLTDLEVVRAASPLNSLYTRMLDSFIGKTVSFLLTTHQSDDIMNFSDFMKFFERFVLEYTESAPITKSSFSLTRNVGMLHSALALDLADEDYSVDNIKYEEYINSPEFAYYLKVAEKYGFYVDKNIPWRLVANVSSRPMQLFLEKDSSITGLRPIFATYYQAVHRDDLSALRFAAYNAYITIATTRPDIGRVDVRDGKMYTFFEKRQPVTPAQSAEIYGDDKWLELYIKIKNNEKSLNFESPSVSKIVKNSINLKNLLDISTAMDYINKVFRDIPAIEGSSNDFRNRIFFKKIKDRPFSDYKEFLERTVKVKKR